MVLVGQCVYVLLLVVDYYKIMHTLLEMYNGNIAHILLQ